MKFENKLILKNIEKKILTKYTKADLAKKMKVKVPTVYAILKNLENNKGITTTTLIKIADAGDVSFQELLEY